VVHDAATAAPPAHRRRTGKESPTSPPPIGPPPVARCLRTITSHSCAAEVNLSNLLSRPLPCSDAAAGPVSSGCGCVAAGRDAANLRTDGCHWDAEALNQLAKVGRHTALTSAERLIQVRRKRHNRLDIATRSDCRKQYAHQNSPAIVLETWVASHWEKRASM
jgi:hypothetical protein